MTQLSSLVFLQDFFEQTADEKPDGIAVDDDGTLVTYAELEARANRISHYLKSKGCGPNERVCIFTGKNANAYAAVLGALKAGACLVPLTDQMPEHRLRQIISSTEPRAVIYELGTRDRLRALEGGYDTLELGGGEQALVGQPDNRPDRHDLSPSDLAYIIFTSGSTGEPKGVMVRHSNITQFLSLCHRYFNIEPGSRFAHHSDLAFDPSLFDLFHCWSTGGTLVPFNKRSYRINPGKFVVESKVNVWFSVPSAIATMAQAGQVGDESFASLKHILLTGEPIPPKLARQWLDAYPETTLYNVYGTTETAIISHWYTLPRDLDTETSVPVGEVLPGMRVSLMEHGQPVPDGEIGESVVTGAQVSPGYWRNEAENAARFIPNHIDPNLPQGSYRTGDLLVKRPDGLYTYVGRADSQVKVRGHRVELNEVETAILPFPGIDEAAVLLSKDETRPDEAYLVGFVASTEDVDTGSLTTYLQEKVPPYMVPSRFITIPGRLPRNANQKVDRRALQDELETGT